MKIRRRTIALLLLFGLALGIATCNAPPSSVDSGAGDRPFRVWWQQGFYPEETEQIRRLVAEWEGENGTPVELTFYSDSDLLKETNNAIAAAEPPDMLFSTGKIEPAIPGFAWDDRLVDVGDIIEPVKDRYDPAALESVRYKNAATRKTAYYAVPLSQQTVHLHHWKPLLETAGMAGDEIPREWDEFWQFWKTAQEQLRQRGREDIYAFAFPMSPAASDTYFIFEQFLEAHNVKIVSPAGQLQVGAPKVRQGIVTALAEYADLYKDGYVPPGAVNWGNAENNVTFLSRDAVLTANPSLSIPGSQRQDPATYFDALATIRWPDKPDGEPMSSVVSVKKVVIFKESRNQEAAKSLLAYLIRPDNLAAYLKGAQGRYFPVMPELRDDPFWTDPEDPHISVSARDYRQTRSFPQSFNPAYSQVLSDNVWGQAIRAVVADGISPEAAADRAIAEIRAIFSDWER